MLKPRQLVAVLTLGLIVGSLFFVFSPEIARSQPTTPTPRGLEVVGTALMELEEAPLAGVYVHGNYAFVGGQSEPYYAPGVQGVRIVDLANPADPQLVGRIPLRSRSPVSDHSHGDAVVTHIASEVFQGDIAIVLQGVPDSFSLEEHPQPYGIWDVTDPRNPEFLSIVSFGTVHGHEGGQLGDKPKDSKAVAGNYFYTLYDAEKGTRISQATTSVHLAVVDISDPRNPLVVGDWQDNGDVAILGLSLNEAGTRAYLTGVYPPPWGLSARDGYVYILDIQNPSQPREIGRYIYPLRGVPSSVSKAVPNSDDSLLVLADHSWEHGKCGILTILDISDLATIYEISNFALPESDDFGCNVIATDVAVKGSLIYSTWGGGGMRIIDLSDPRRPVQVGEFRGPGSTNTDWWLSDVALKDDLVLATRVWGSGLYVLRKTAEAPTVVIDETKSMRVSAADVGSGAGSEALPGFHVSWEWPDGTRETAWDGFLNVGGVDYEIGDDGWVYVRTRQRPPFPAEKVDLTITGVYSWGVTIFDREADPAHVIFDRVQIFLTASERIDVGASISWSAFYEYDGRPFLGVVTMSAESDQVGTFLQTVQAISDPVYGLEAFTANELEVTFDRVDITLQVKTTEVPVGEQAEILVVARYASDNAPFEGTIMLSRDLIQREEGTYSYTVISLEDTAYGLTVFSSNTVEVTFFVPPFYAQPSFLVVLLAIASAAGVAVFLLRRRRRRLKGAEARVDRVRL